MTTQDRCWLRVILMMAWLAGAVFACGGNAATNHDASAGDGAVALDAPNRDDAGAPDAPVDAAPVDGAPVDGSPIDGMPIDATPIDGGGAFICDPIRQTGCGAGEKCDIAATGTFGCVPDGPLGDFRACGDKDAPNRCAKGLTCSGTFSAANRCTQICSELDNRCLRGERCDTEHQTSDGRQYLTCTTNEVCNPLLDDCAEPNTHCTYLVLRSACLATGTVADGQTCQIRQGNVQDCMQGSACVNVGPGSVFRCVRMCDAAPGAAACAGGAACNPLATVGPQAVGWCALP